MEAAGVAGAAQRGDEMLVRGRKAGQREMRKLSVRTNYKVPSEDVSPYFKSMTPQESAQVSAGLSGRCCIPEHATTWRSCQHLGVRLRWSRERLELPGQACL